MKNHELLNYGFVEGVEFEGSMPPAAEKIGTVGASDVVVEAHGHLAKGMDALEVVDIEAVFAGVASDEVTGETEDTDFVEGE